MNWPFWWELVVRSSVILIAGEAIRRLNRSQPAAFRHRLLLWTLLLLAILPVLAIALPAIRIPEFIHARHEASGRVTVVEQSSTVLEAPTRRRFLWPVLIWLVGAIVALTPVVIGAFAAWRMVRRARPFDGGVLSAGTDILLSKELSAPLTCGFWHPCILLPAAAVTWRPNRLQAVLLHEFAHVRRRDVTAQVIAHVVAALWWFQPLVWIVRGSLRVESELSCDAEVLQSGFRPSAYAAELLALAKTLGRDYRLSSCAISMARSSDLERRVRRILDPHAVAASPTKIFLLLAALGAIAVTASALTLNSDGGFKEQGGSIMKRTLISGLLTSLGLSAATVSGTVHDPGGSAVSEATVVVFNPDNGARQEATTDSEGKFSLSGEPAGQYILKVEKAGLSPILREFDLKAESNIDRQFTMTNEGAELSADDIVNDADHPGKAVRIGGRVAQSNLVQRVPPLYPTAAKAAGTQGTVQIQATISKDGVPVELRVVSTPSSELAESALVAVRQWRYRPTLLNGEPVEVSTTVIVNYTLAP